MKSLNFRLSAARRVAPKMRVGSRIRPETPGLALPLPRKSFPVNLCDKKRAQWRNLSATMYGPPEPMAGCFVSGDFAERCAQWAHRNFITLSDSIFSGWLQMDDWHEDVFAAHWR